MMMTPTRLLTMALATGGILACHAGAQQIPGPEDGPAVVTVTQKDGQIEMRDADNGKALMLSKTLGLWDDRGYGNSLEPAIEFQAQPTGYDVIYTYTNSGKTTRKLGLLNAGMITLGSKITYPEFRYISETETADNNDNYKSRQAVYPQTTYSPAWVLQNPDYAVGVSIQYPILDYKHDVRLTLHSPQGRFAEGEGGRAWKVEFLLSNLGNETPENELYNSGVIAPGQTRTYVVSVRVTKKPQEWVRTLVPYRNFFRSQYGGVEYVRDTTTIVGRNFTTDELCTDDNPFGYGVSRPDLNGWTGLIDGLMERSGWGTQLFWTTSGSYRNNIENNMPFQFTTNWKATPALATATDAKLGFPRMPAAGQRIGFWWGRSVQVADRWDDKVLEPLDPHNKVHRAAAFAEMDLAVKAGATTIGLDTFCAKHTPVWDLVSWLDDLKARYPGVRFCAEPVSCDLIHRKIATYYRGHKDRTKVKNPAEIDGFYNPFYLADFLLPGHETWGAFRWSRYADWFGMEFSDAEKEQKLIQIASMGYIPVSLADVNLTAPIVAANSWEFTVPQDLREDGNNGDGKVKNDDDGGKNHDDQGDLFPTFELFEKAFAAGDMRADLNKDGSLDLFDYTAWQNAHAQIDKRSKGDKGKTPDVAKGNNNNNNNNAKAGKAKKPKLQVFKVPAPGNAAKAPQAPKNGGIVGSKGDSLTATADAPRNRRRPRPLGTPDFTAADIAAALAKARGLDKPAATTAEVPDDK